MDRSTMPDVWHHRRRRLPCRVSVPTTFSLSGECSCYLFFNIVSDEKKFHHPKIIIIKLLEFLSNSIQTLRESPDQRKRLINTTYSNMGKYEILDVVL